MSDLVETLRAERDQYKAWYARAMLDLKAALEKEALYQEEITKWKTKYNEAMWKKV